MTENEFVENVNRIVPAVRRYARLTTGNTDAADDIVQETIALAWRSIHKYDPARSSFGTWFVTLYRTMLGRYYRNEEESGNGIGVSIAELVVEDTQDDTGPEVAVLPEYDAKINLEQALTLLGGIHEKVIRDCFIGGLTFAEVSEDTGIAPRKVRRIVGTGLKRLRQIMKGQHVMDNAEPINGEGGVAVADAPAIGDVASVTEISQALAQETESLMDAGAVTPATPEA